MFGRWTEKAARDTEGHALADVVRAELGGGDDEARRIVTAIIGLLGGVAYADRDFADAEESTVRAALSRMNGMTPRAVDAVLRVLRAEIVSIATVQAPRYCRVLVELADRELRLQVLELLLDVASADGQISHDEVVLLRNTTTALGLEQRDYNALQAQHRDKLSSIRGGGPRE